MKTYKITISLIITILFISSCTDIIELDLKNTEPHIVIEAKLNISDSTFRADITMSNDFYNNEDFKLVTNAEVILQKTGGETYTIPEAEDGVYFLNNIIAETNDEFTVHVTDTDGMVYEANTITPYPAEIAQILPTPFEPPHGGTAGDTSQYVQIMTFWKDSLNVDNYYRIKTYINNEFNARDYLLTDDRVSDGDTLASVSIHELYSGDLFKVELLSSDQKYFDYFMDLAIIQGQGPSSTTPYNPKGNFNNGAFGYFGIYSVSEIELLLP